MTTWTEGNRERETTLDWYFLRAVRSFPGEQSDLLGNDFPEGEYEVFKDEGISTGAKYISEGFMNYLLFPMED